MQRISVNLKNYCKGNQLSYNNEIPAIGNKNNALQKPFDTDFLTVIVSLEAFVICWVAQDSRPRCGPRHPILHFNIFFYVKFFATITLSWNSLKCFLWYLLELSEPFIKNENPVLPILIEKKFKQKIYFCLLKMRSTFFKEWKSNFFDYTWTEITGIIFSASCKKFKICPFILLKKRRLADGIHRPKAVNSPLQ